jgi:hypothetical protein
MRIGWALIRPQSPERLPTPSDGKEKTENK